MFVEKYGPAQETATVLDGVWGAFEHSEALIGAAWLVASPSSTGRGRVAVVPERRGLGVGSDLLQILVDEARTRGITALAYEHTASDPGPSRLISSLGLKAAHRVHEGRARTIVFVPNPPLRNY
jgi:GNAT superfamily N-acetyltransferase